MGSEPGSKLNGQSHRKSGAHVYLAADLNGATVQIDKLLDDAQPQARPRNTGRVDR